MRTPCLAAASLCLGLLGCSGLGTDDNAAVTAALGNDFTGNSVRIHGVRSTAADPKYPCLNELDVCLVTDPAGVTAAIPDLCPSVNTPEGTWSFTYVLYADATCTTPLENIVCPPTLDETLEPGHNHNDVVCTTRNADKDFDFCIIDPVTGAGSEECGPPVCIPPDHDTCNPVDWSPPPPVVGTTTVYHLANVNTQELWDVDFEVTQYLSGGNLVLELCALHNPVSNAMLGVDHFWYGAVCPPYGLLSANEPGWTFNYDGTQADGFGSFASGKSSNPAGRGGTACANPLIFTVGGDPTGGTNAPLDLAIHVRWDDDCSGFISNRTANSVGSSPGCQRLPDCGPECP